MLLQYPDELFFRKIGRQTLETRLMKAEFRQ